MHQVVFPAWDLTAMRLGCLARWPFFGAPGCLEQPFVVYFSHVDAGVSLRNVQVTDVETLCIKHGKGFIRGSDRAPPAFLEPTLLARQWAQQLFPKFQILGSIQSLLIPRSLEAMTCSYNKCQRALGLTFDTASFTRDWPEALRCTAPFQVSAYIAGDSCLGSCYWAPPPRLQARPDGCKSGSHIFVGRGSREAGGGVGGMGRRIGIL